jgi:hypothetical protein
MRNQAHRQESKTMNFIASLNDHDLFADKYTVGVIETDSQLKFDVVVQFYIDNEGRQAVSTTVFRADQLIEQLALMNELDLLSKCLPNVIDCINAAIS